MSGRERYGMNMTPAEQRRGAWVVVAVLYALGPLPVGLVLVGYGLIGHGPIEAVAYGLACLVVPVRYRHHLHDYFTPGSPP
jgi:hypothetical protein